MVKTVVIRIDEWLKLRGKSERFLSCSRHYLSAVSELQLSWCKVIKFSGGKMAGWVSEIIWAWLESCRGFILS